MVHTIKKQGVIGEARALRQYRSLEAALERNWGTVPQPETLDLTEASWAGERRAGEGADLDEPGHDFPTE